MKDLLKPLLIVLCVLGAVAFFIYYYREDTPPKITDDNVISTRYIQRNGYTVYCYKNKIRVRYMDSIYYTFDSIKNVQPPKDFYPEY